MDQYLMNLAVGLGLNPFEAREFKDVAPAEEGPLPEIDFAALGNAVRGEPRHDRPVRVGRPRQATA